MLLSPRIEVLCLYVYRINAPGRGRLERVVKVTCYSNILLLAGTDEYNVFLIELKNISLRLPDVEKTGASTFGIVIKWYLKGFYTWQVYRDSYTVYIHIYINEYTCR